MKTVRNQLGFSSRQMALFLGIRPSTYSMSEVKKKGRDLTGKPSMKMTGISQALSKNPMLPPNEKYQQQIVTKQTNAEYKLGKLINETEFYLGKAVRNKKKMDKMFSANIRLLNGIALLKTMDNLTPKNHQFLNILEALVLGKLRTCDEIEQGILQTEIETLTTKLEKYKSLTQLIVQ